MGPGREGVRPQLLEDTGTQRSLQPGQSPSLIYRVPQVAARRDRTETRQPARFSTELAWPGRQQVCEGAGPWAAAVLGEEPQAGPASLQLELGEGSGRVIVAQAEQAALHSLQQALGQVLG